MDETCNEKTTLMCKYGTFQFEVVPFGLIILGATFERMMDRILANVENVKCYVDDVVIHTTNREEHVDHIETVFQGLRKHSLRRRLKNCFFMQSRVELLGDFVDKDGVWVKVEKNPKCVAPHDEKRVVIIPGA